MLHQHQTQYVGVKDTITSTSNTICQRQRHSVLHQHQREYVSVKDTITSTSNTVCQRQTLHQHLALLRKIDPNILYILKKSSNVRFFQKV